MLPTAGLRLQFTVWVMRLATVAENWRVCPAESTPLTGATLTVIGGATIVTLADALLLGSATLVAIAVIVRVASTTAGGV